MSFLQNRTRLTTLICLLLLLIALAGLIAILNWRDHRTDSGLTLRAPETVRHIEIRSAKTASGEAVITRLSKDDSGWILSGKLANADGIDQDVDLPANADRVTPLLGLLQLPRRDNYHIDEIELAELGLAPPRASVTIDDVNFLFGDKTLDGTARYVQVDDRIHLYQEFVYPLLNAGPGVFIAKASEVSANPDN